MKITKSSWNDYVAKLGRIDRRAAIEMEAWLNKYGTVDTNALIEQAYAIANKYGHAAASLACQMYDSVADASGALVPAAEPAEVATIAEVAKAVNGTKSSQPNLINAISRLPRLAAADTMLKNSLRDGAQHAWIPSGDSCAFCFALASRGWEYSSKDLIKRGHAEHIHANCDCTFAIRFNSRDDVEGYDPDTMRDEWENSGSNTRTRMNNMRQKFRLENREKINAQKRALYNKTENQMLRLAKDGDIFVNRSEDLQRYAKKIEPVDGFRDIVIHGDEYSFVFKDKDGLESNVSVADFCDILDRSGNYNGEPIRLLACQAAAGDAIIPKYIAKRYDTVVMAPSEIVNVDFNGNVILANNENDAKMGLETGKWLIFDKNGEVKK